MTAILNIGDTVPIGQVTVNMVVNSLITDINNPNMFAILLQAFQNLSLLNDTALQGPQGNPGQLTFAFRWQNDSRIQPSQLPTNLTNAVADLGKYWVFGVTDQNGNTVATIMYVWWGTTLGFKQLPVGTPGPVGGTPNIIIKTVLQKPGSALGPNGVDSWIAVTGPVSNPVFTFNIASPEGVTGPTSLLSTWPDVDFSSHAPLPGDVFTCSSAVTPTAPTGLTILPITSGGTLAAGTYFYVVTAYTANEETLQSNEVTTGAITGATNSVQLAWSAPFGVVVGGYRVYRGTSIGTLNLLAVIPSPAVTTFTDIGAATTSPTPPTVGSTPGLTIWHAVTPMPAQTAFYTIPQSVFTPLSNVTTPTATIASFAVPPQPFPWKPLVFGQMQIFGVGISLSPLLVGAEVLLGDPSTGAQVAQGFGNALGYVTLVAQSSSIGSPSQAITPTNKLAYVPANHTSYPATVNAGTLYCNLVNQGMAGPYNFNNANSGLVVVVIPVPSQ